MYAYKLNSVKYTVLIVNKLFVSVSGHFELNITAWTQDVRELQSPM